MEKSPMVALVLKSMKGEKGGGEGDGEKSDVGLETAAEEMMAALKEDDAKAFASALKSFIEMCGSYE